MIRRGFMVAAAIVAAAPGNGWAASALLRIADAQRMVSEAPTPVCSGSGRRMACEEIAMYAIGSPTSDGRIEVFMGRWNRDATVMRVGPYWLERHGAWKGVNTAYDVRRAPRIGRDHEPRGRSLAVLAWNVPITIRQRGRTHVEYRVYTPASDTLRIEEVIRAGRSALGLEIAAQHHALAAGRVESSRARLSLESTASAKLLATLFHVEKMDHEEFRACAGNAACVQRLLELNAVVLAANGDHAWTYARSSAGARGPMQFTSGTWGMLQHRYPRAHLPSFATGARDLGMSVRAAMLLVDANFTELDEPAWVVLRRMHGSAFQRALAQYAAAAYNGNPRHAEAAIESCGEQWTKPTCGYLRPETRIYLDKVAAVWPSSGAPGGVPLPNDPPVALASKR